MDTEFLVKWLGERLDKMDAKLDAMQVSGARVDTTLADHGKRIERLQADVEPLRAKVSEARGVAWLVGLLVAAAGFVATVRELVG